MKGYFKEGYETYKRIEYYSIEKRRKESRNNVVDISRKVY